MKYNLSARRRRELCSVLGFPRKNADGDAGISDIALVLYLVLILTTKPKHDYPEHPEARRHYELQGKVGPSRSGKRCGRASVKAADSELLGLELIERDRVENGQGAKLGPDTPYGRKLHPENGKPVEVSDEVLAFIVAVVRDPKLQCNRKAQAIRFAAVTGLRFVGEMDEYVARLGMTREAVKDFFEDLEAAGYARVRPDAPVRGKRRRWLYAFELTAWGGGTTGPTVPAALSTVASAAARETPAPAPACTPAANSTTPAATKPSAGTTFSASEPVRDAFSVTLGDRRGSAGIARSTASSVASPVATPAPSAPVPVTRTAPSSPARPRSVSAAAATLATTSPSQTSAGASAGVFASVIPAVIAFAPEETPESLAPRLWLPFHMAVAIDLAKEQEGELEPHVIVERFMKPVIALQQKGSDKHALQWALEAALTYEHGPLHEGNSANRFAGFLRSVFNAHRGKGGPPPKSDHPAIRAVEELQRRSDRERVERVRREEEEGWRQNADAVLAGVAKNGRDHPNVKAKLSKLLHNLADRATERAISDGCRVDEANRIFREKRARLEAGIDAGVTTWDGAQALTLAAAPVEPERRREPTRDELKALGARASSAASFSGSEPASAAMQSAPTRGVMSLAAPRSAASVSQEQRKADARNKLFAPRDDIPRNTAGQRGVMAASG